MCGDVVPGPGALPIYEDIRQTLESVLTQGYPDLELIVVDGGGSTDETVEIIREYSARLFLIRSIFFPKASIAARSLDFTARL